MLQNRGIAFSAARTEPGGHTFSGSSMLELEFAELSHPGKVREHNEDFIGHCPPSSSDEAKSRGWLFMLADGVGGQDKGEVASRLAVETLQSGFRDFRPNETPTGCLQRLVQAANLKILETANGYSMSTTLVACLLRYDRITIAHAGDSRCYLIRRGQTTQLTRDHTLVGEQVRMGLLSEKEAAESEKRHVLNRSLGSDMVVRPEIDEHQLLPHDVLMLSSDGLHGYLSTHEIALLIGKSESLSEAAQTLISTACENDGSDNLSVQLVRIKGVERMGMYRGRPYKLR
jgi:PPM family protein phosphatase